ncbi:hypothetical protein GCM10020367_59650 [Streptomyces sannanensis]|uniref:Uncharacterized protein n=1 Tax=Streptomyces sannanensis TaxID=285536 RepID=A0ABP6SKL6_9ACTN
MTAARTIPAAEDLTYGQAKGWNCVWCGCRLDKGAVSVGWACGREGDLDLDCEVFACPACGKGGPS